MGDALPVAVALAAPHQRCGDDIVAVAIDIRPDVDPFAHDALHRKAAAIDDRINVFNMESAAVCDALDSSGLFCSR